MATRIVRRASLVGLFVFSLIALADILVGVIPILVTGHVPPPAKDEGTQAHIFQLSIAALMPVGLVFLATADWATPRRVTAAMAVPALATATAFALLYYFEHLS